MSMQGLFRCWCWYLVSVFAWLTTLSSKLGGIELIRLLAVAPPNCFRSCIACTIISQTQPIKETKFVAIVQRKAKEKNKRMCESPRLTLSEIGRLAISWEKRDWTELSWTPRLAQWREKQNREWIVLLSKLLSYTLVCHLRKVRAKRQFAHCKCRQWEYIYSALKIGAQWKQHRTGVHQNDTVELLLS